MVVMMETEFASLHFTMLFRLQQVVARLQVKSFEDSGIMDPESQGTLPLGASNSLPEPYKPGKKSKKRKLLCCCGICGAIAVVLIVLLIILIFTVFKQKDPRISIDSINLENINLNIGNIFTNPDLAVDLDLGTNVSVKNPNYAGFAYENTTAYIFYQGKVVATTPVPAGEVKSRRTAKLSSTTNVHLSGSIINANLSSDITAGVLPLVTTVNIRGTAKVLGIFKVKNVKSSAYCDVLIFIQNQTQGFNCDYKVKL